LEYGWPSKYRRLIEHDAGRLKAALFNSRFGSREEDLLFPIDGDEFRLQDESIIVADHNGDIPTIWVHRSPVQ
jgi:hypothetical protein